MSGLEIAGLVLSTIPLFMKAKSYAYELAKVMKILQHQGFGVSLRALQTKLGTQDVLFRVISHRLRNVIQAKEYELKALVSAAHELRSNEQADLSDLFLQCCSNIREIQHSLSYISRLLQRMVERDESEFFRSVPDTLIRLHGAALSSRMALAWKESSIDLEIDKLRGYVNDFRFLAQEVIETLKPKLPITIGITNFPKSPSDERDEDTPDIIGRYKIIQHCSTAFFNIFMLKWQCTIHAGHRVYLSNSERVSRPRDLDLIVRAADIKSSNEHALRIEIQHCKCADLPQVSTNPNMQSSATPAVTNIRRIGQFKRAGIAQDNLTEALMASLALNATAPDTENLGEKSNRPKKHNRVHFHKNIPIELLVDENAQSVNQCDTEKMNTVFDLHCVDDHCHHFQRYFDSCSSKTYVGSLEDRCTQRFYACPQGPHVPDTPQTLYEIIRTLADNPLSPTLPLQTLLHTAGSVASLLLQYHSTPWLPEIWESKHICFFDRLGLDSGKQTCPPYIVMSISKPSAAEIKGKGKERATAAQPPTNVELQGIRNKSLFSLGIVLLELGFSTPWSRLRSRAAGTFKLPVQSEYKIADRLARELVRSVGMDYVRIGRKCLACDFGVGETDLENEDLQRKFISDVIEVLERVENGIRRLQQGI
ncbi:hypothetical protein F4777DRAFT_568984 [Nemania sp. FL0916]|nr:hypothetical protein F4777DRAFT_568984 [Nemania sp. FL0916]